MPVVEASGTATRRGVTGSLSGLMELAMSQEILQCAIEGVSDPEVVRDRMRAARERVKAGAIAQAEAAQAEAND